MSRVLLIRQTNALIIAVLLIAASSLPALSQQNAMEILSTEAYLSPPEAIASVVLALMNRNGMPAQLGLARTVSNNFRPVMRGITTSATIISGMSSSLAALNASSAASPDLAARTS